MGMYWITLLLPGGRVSAIVDSPMMKFSFWVFLCLSLYSHSAATHQGVAAQLERINRAIENNPQNQALLIQRGALYSHDGQYARAEQDFRQAETLGAPVSVAYELGLLFYRSKEFARAQRYFDRSIKQFPQHAAAYELRGRTAHRLGDNRQALADFSMFFKLQPQPNPGHYIFAAKLHEANTHVAKTDALKATELTAAIDLLDKGMANIGLTPQLQRYAVTLELQRNRPQHAIIRLQSLEPLLNGSPSWKLEMAQLFLQTGQPARAKHLLSKAETEVAALKVTPARLELAEKIAQLNQALSRQP